MAGGAPTSPSNKSRGGSISNTPGSLQHASIPPVTLPALLSQLSAVVDSSSTLHGISSTDFGLPSNTSANRNRDGDTTDNGALALENQASNTVARDSSSGNSECLTSASNQLLKSLLPTSSPTPGMCKLSSNAIVSFKENSVSALS